MSEAEKVCSRTDQSVEQATYIYFTSTSKIVIAYHVMADVRVVLFAPDNKIILSQIRSQLEGRT